MIAFQGSSGPVVIHDLKVARVITDREQLRRLAPFMGQEITVKQAAGALGLPLTATYKITQRFLHLGLLQETRQEQRAGRAIRHYRAPTSFFTPFSVLGLEEMGRNNRQVALERFERNFTQVLRHELAGNWGALTQVLPSGEPFYDLVNLDGQCFDQFADTSPIFLSGWNLVRLTPAEARTLQRDWLKLLQPHLHRPGADGDLYLTGVFLCRDVQGAG